MARYESQGGIRSMLGIVPPLRYFTGKPSSTGYGSATTAEQACQGWDGSGKVVVITGASSGLGAESARVLAARGATCVLLVRNVQATEKVVQSIKQATPSADIRVIQCDLEDLPSVAKAAHDFLALGLPLHVLMLNAGVMAPPYQTTKQGLELQIGVNHVAHALLTRLLLPCIVKTASAPGSPQGRIICLSSTGHMMAPRHGLRARKRINSEKGYNPWVNYGQSKLANILFARELAERLKTAGVQNVATVSCHPGVIPTTELVRHNKHPKWLLKAIWFTFKTTPQGAATQVYLATAGGSLPSGEYYADCQISSSSSHAHSKEVGSKLWEWTEAQVQPFLDKQLEAQQPIKW